VTVVSRGIILIDRTAWNDVIVVIVRSGEMPYGMGVDRPLPGSAGGVINGNPRVTDAAIVIDWTIKGVNGLLTN